MWFNLHEKLLNKCGDTTESYDFGELDAIVGKDANYNFKKNVYYSIKHQLKILDPGQIIDNDCSGLW